MCDEDYQIQQNELKNLIDDISILNSDFNHILDSRIENINDYYNARIETGELFILKPKKLSSKLYFLIRKIISTTIKQTIYLPVSVKL